MIGRALGRQVLQAFAIALPASALLVTALQALRLAPVAAAAAARPAEWAAALGATAVVAIEAVAPAGFAIAVVLVVLRWRADGELLAARAAGVSVLRLARGPLVAAVLAALLVGAVSAFAAPAATRRLQATWAALSPRAVAGAIRPGAMVELTPGLLVYAARRSEGGGLHDVVVADRDTVMAARHARLRVVRRPSPALVLEARQGALRRGDLDARFARLSLPLDLGDEIAARREAIANMSGGPGRASAAVTFALVAAACVLASLLLAARPAWLGLTVAALVAAREIVARVGQLALPELGGQGVAALTTLAAALPAAVLALLATRRSVW